MEQHGQRGEKHESQLSALKSVAPFLTLGIQLALSIAVFFFIGRWVDEKLGTAPWLMLVGVVIGCVGSIIKFIQTVTKIAQEQEQEDADRRKEA